MKILVASYACNPYGGSEPGVGWTAVCRIANRHDVWVLTDVHNREGWERGAREGVIPGNVKVRFLRDRSSCSENRFIAHLQSWLNYASFSRQVLAAALDWHREIGFDLCHQVTIAGWRMPSPLWRLPVPFVWGPIGGAGFIPRAFRCILSPQARAFESLRDLQTTIASRSRAFRECIKNTAVVFAANEETETFLRPFRGERPMIRLPIASFSMNRIAQLTRPKDSIPREGPLHLFAGGNMEGRKGISLALRALALVAKQGVNFRYTIAGGGPEIPSLKKLCAQLGLDNNVEFHPGFQGDDYLAALHRSDVYFLPSFRESTPVTLLEACLAGCYPVVADTSAQGEIVRMAGGKAVPTKRVRELIEGLAEALIECDRNRASLPTLVMATRERLIALFDSARYDQATREAYQIALDDAQRSSRTDVATEN